MKNKIGILENDIYIFPIVNSVNLLVHSFDGLHSLDGLEGSTFPVRYWQGKSLVSRVG